MKSLFQSAAALSLLALLSACAVPAPQGEKLASADAVDNDVVCFYESPTGTNRKVRRCMSKEEYNKNVDQAQRYGNEIKMPPPLQR